MIMATKGARMTTHAKLAPSHLNTPPHQVIVMNQVAANVVLGMEGKAGYTK